MITIPHQAVLGLLSGLLTVGLGVWLLSRSRRAAGALAFGAFGLAWGAQVVGSNVQALGASTSRPLDAVEEALLLLLAPLLVAFLGVTAGRPLTAIERTLVLAAFGVAGVSALLYAARPDLFVRDAGRLAGTAYASPHGPLALLLGAGPLYAAQCAFVLVAIGRMRRTPSPLAARQWLLLATGMGAYLAYAVPYYGLRFASALPVYLAERGGFETLVHASIFLGSFGALAYALARVPHASRHGPPVRRAFIAALLTSFLAGTATGASSVVGAPTIGLVGLFRVALVGVVGLAIAEHRLFDLGTTRTRPLLAAFGAALGLGILLVLEQVLVLAGTSTTATAAASGVAGALFVLAVALPFAPPVRRFLDRALRAALDPVGGRPAYAYEIYRAAIEDHRLRGLDASASAPTLAALRTDLGLDARDHEVIGLVVPVGPRRPRSVESNRETIASAGPAVAPAVPRQDGGTTTVPYDGEPALALPPERGPPPRGDPVSLAALLSERPGAGVGAEAALQMTRAILSALADVHASGRVHGAVSPSNVSIAPDGGVRLSPAGVRRDGPAWVPPEVLAGGRATPASDVHGAGAILHRLLSGRHYVRVDGLAEDEMRTLLVHAKPVPLLDAPAAVRSWLDRALARDPSGRFPDARAARDALPSIGDDGGCGGPRSRAAES